MMNHRIFAFLAVLVLVFAVTTGASAAGAVSVTTHDHNLTQSFPSANPCSHVPGTVTITVNDVFHITTLANGTLHATGTSEGTFTFVPDDTTQPTYTGRFTNTFGDNNNLQNGSETSILVVHGVGSDGSTITFHGVIHLSVSATGVTLSFDKETCG